MNKKSTKERFMDILEFFTLEGIDITLENQNGTIAANLNTQAKSHCYLKIVDNQILAFRRYDRIDVVDNERTVMHYVYGCNHGRDYFNHKWIALLKKYNFGDPRGETRGRALDKLTPEERKALGIN